MGYIPVFASTLITFLVLKFRSMHESEKWDATLTKIITSFHLEAIYAVKIVSCQICLLGS